MKSPRYVTWTNARSTRTAAFTLIELLTVMAIILLLAGLILNIASHAQTKSAMTKATAEIQALSSAIEAYKIDNGTYPRDSSSGAVTDILIPQQNQYFDPAQGNAYKNASNFLYKALSGFDTSAGTQNKIITKPYFTFQPVQLGAMTSGATVTPTSSEMYIQDPFGFSYGYSTAYQAAVDAATNSGVPGATPSPDRGYNPTFDLWSTAGYSSSQGRSTPSNGPSASPAAVYSSLWVKNW